MSTPRRSTRSPRRAARSRRARSRGPRRRCRCVAGSARHPGTGPVAGLDHPLIDQDAIGRRRPDVPGGTHEDVGDQPGDGALAVRAGDRDHRDLAVGVAKPGRRRRAGLIDARRPALELALLRAGELGALARRDVALGEGERRFRDERARSAPRHGHRRSSGLGPDRWTSRGPAASPCSARRRRSRRRRRRQRGPQPGRDGGPEPDEGVPRRDPAGRTRCDAARSRPRP